MVLAYIEGTTENYMFNMNLFCSLPNPIFSFIMYNNLNIQFEYEVCGKTKQTQLDLNKYTYFNVSWLFITSWDLLNTPIGVLAPISAQSWPSAQPPHRPERIWGTIYQAMCWPILQKNKVTSTVVYQFKGLKDAF